jgi:hypothetical protein
MIAGVVRLFDFASRKSPKGSKVRFKVTGSSGISTGVAVVCPYRTGSCRTFSEEAVLQAALEVLRPAGLQAAAKLLWIPEILFGDDKILALLYTLLL